MQVLIISSDKVDWGKMGTCVCVDPEPAPPTLEDFASPRGWREVNKFIPDKAGKDYLFPSDQILLVMTNGKYKVIKEDGQRNLGNLNQTKNYLVWYHHLLQQEDWKGKQAA